MLAINAPEPQANYLQYEENNMQNDLNLIKNHDIRNANPITETMRIRSQARMEQIVASPISEPVPAKSRSQFNLQPAGLKRWGLRLAAVPMLTAGIVAASVMLPSPQNSQSSFPGWTAIPSAVAAPLLGPAEEACLARLNWDGWIIDPRWGPPNVSGAPDLAEQRGDWVLLMYSNDSIANAGCVVRMAGGQAEIRQNWTWESGGGGSWSLPIGRESGFDEDGNWFDTEGRDGLDFSTGGSILDADSGIGFFQYSRMFMPGFGPMILFSAAVDDTVAAVEIPVGGGHTISTTIANGNAVAWWPAELGEVEHPEGRPFNWRLLLNVTYTDGSTRQVGSFWQARPVVEQERVRRWQDEDRRRVSLPGAPQVVVSGDVDELRLTVGNE
jgi:hypothetical protein